MRSTLFLALLPVALVAGAVSLPPVSAQMPDDTPDQTHPQRQAVLDTVQRFFDALEQKDGDALDAVLTPQGVTHALRVRGDSAVVVARPHEAARASITGSDAALLERMFDPVVHVREHIAVVWTPYDFHVNGNFSHCGIDVFSLIRDRGEWRISSISYTIEQDGCPDRPPPGE